MDWIDPKYASSIEQAAQNLEEGRRGKRLAAQLGAALAQPMDVWSQAFENGISKLKWPTGCSLEGSFLWSTIVEEQAEVLVRAGLSAQKLASIVSGVPEGTTLAEQLSDVVGLMDQPLESMAFHWMESADAIPHSALATIALAWHLPEHARRPGNEWLSQWISSCLQNVESYQPDEDECVLSHLVMQSELPLLIAVGTAAPKRVLLTEASLAMDAVAQYLEQSEDDPAPWLAHGAVFLRACLASVLRCRLLANTLGLRKWFPPQQRALAGLLKHAARWSRPNGTQLLGAHDVAPKAKAMWNALIKQTRNPRGMAAAMTLSGIGQQKRAEVRREVSTTNLPDESDYCSNAACAAMVGDWRQKGCRVAVDFSEADICLEALGPKGESLLGGYWNAQVEIDGQAQMQLEEWEEVCWYNDDDVDYLELEAKFGNRARIQRQIALLREERMLYLADALFVDGPAKLQLKSEIPVTGGVHFQPASKSTEGFLEVGSAKCLVLPLYLPEWRRQLSMAQSSSQLTGNEESLELVAAGEGAALYMPTLISLCNGHAKLDFTWRHLTVGEDLRIVKPDEAKAFRVQIGGDQWLVYRNLAEPVRRTALGMHTLADFYTGRFDVDTGDLDEIIEVQPIE